MTDLNSDESLAHEPSDNAALMRRAADMIRHEFEGRTWQAFWRTTVDGVASSEVAAELIMTSGAVRQAKYKVLRRLRQELGDRFDPA